MYIGSFCLCEQARQLPGNTSFQWDEGRKQVVRHHHSRHRKKHSRRRTLLIGIVLAALYVLTLLLIQVVGNKIEHKEAPVEPVGSLEGRFTENELTYRYMNQTWKYRRNDLTNILMIGVDWADTEQKKEASRYKGQADFLQLVSIDKGNKTISTIHIDRDTLTPIRIYGPFGDYAGVRETQICLSHAYGNSEKQACENTVWAVSHLLGGIPIKGYMVMDIGGIAAVNDALGGVTVTLEDDFTHLDPAMHKGATLKLRGRQAEYYVRGRLGVGAGTNISRMTRQRTFVESANALMLEGMKKDMNYVGGVLDKISGHITTNLSRGWMINTAYSSCDYDRTGVHSIYGVHEIGADGFMGFTPDPDSLGELLTSFFFEEK